MNGTVESQATKRESSQVQEDWKVDIDPSNHVDVPSFIRLFVIRRVLANCSINELDKIKDLVNSMENTDEKTKQTAQDILFHLLNGGIKKYMSDWFTEKDNQINVIEIIFKQIILKKFEKEYHDITSYTTNSKDKDKDNNEHEYQQLVFNLNDLMSLIFQFLKFDYNAKKGELNQCSLVNSYWLYQTWKIKFLLTTKIQVTSLIKRTMKASKNNNNKKKKKNTSNTSSNNSNTCGISIWQRLSNAKWIRFRSDQISTRPSRLVLNRIGMLNNVIQLNCLIYKTHIDILKVLMYNCKDKIESFQVHMRDDYYQDNKSLKKIDNVLSPLELTNNTRDITVSSMYFYIKWSQKCKILSLRGTQNISRSWCNYVINNCDCNGIENLTFRNTTFAWDDGGNGVNGNVLRQDLDELLDDDEKKTLLKNLARKFVNIKQFNIGLEGRLDNTSLILFWKYLTPIIKKNNCQIELSTDTFSKENWDKLCEMIINDNIKINKLEFWFRNYCRKDHRPDIKSLEIFLFKTNLKCLTIDNWERISKTVENVVQCFKHPNINSDKLLSSMEMIEISNEEVVVPLNVMVDILKLNFVIKQKVFVHLKFNVSYTQEKFINLFSVLCEKVAALLIEYEIPINISLKILRIENRKQFEKIYNQIFVRLLGKSILDKCDYNEPVCNIKWCKPLLSTISKMTYTPAEGCRFQVANAEKLSKRPLF